MTLHCIALHYITSQYIKYASHCVARQFPVYWELIVAFVDAGAAVQLNCGFGLTPLHIAVRYRRLDLIDALLAAGADASAQDDWGDVPAVYAMVGTGEQVWWGPW